MIKYESITTASIKFNKKNAPMNMSTRQNTAGRKGAVTVFYMLYMIVCQLSRVIIWNTAMNA